MSTFACKRKELESVSKLGRSDVFRSQNRRRDLPQKKKNNNKRY